MGHKTIIRIKRVFTFGFLALFFGCSNNSDEMFRQAQAEAELGSPVRAIELLTRIQNLDPTFTPAYLLAGKMFLDSGNPAAAIDQYKRGLIAGADSTEITRQIGQVYLKQNNLVDAYKYFGQTLNLDPQNIEALIGMAAVLYQQKLYAQAQKFYQQALAEEPNNYTAMNGVAYAYMAQKNIGGALEMFQKAIESNPVSGDAYVGKALALAKTSDVPLEQVQTAFEQARERDPKNQEAAKTFIKFIDNSAFELDYQIDKTKAYLADFGGDTEALKFLGSLFIKKSKSDGPIWLDAAEQTYKRILSANPEDHEAHARLATIYILTDRPQLAVLRAKMAFEIEPTGTYAALVRQAEAVAARGKTP